MDEQAPFCPSCGASQIKVAPREPVNEGSAAPQAMETGAALPGAMNLTAALAPGQIQWKKFARTVWPLALIGGLATGFYPPLGAVVVVPASAIIGLRLYRKRHFGQIRTGQGALLGAYLAFLSFLVFLVMFGAFYAIDGSQFREALVHGANEAAARNPDPHVQELMHSLVSSDQGIMVLVAVSLMLLLIALMIFASLAGALATSFSGNKHTS